MSTALLIATSITTMVLQNCLLNSSCKTKLKSAKHINLFNILIYSVCVIIFGLLLLKETLSPFTFFIGIIFGVVTSLSNLFKMLSLSTGPMNITILVTTSSMIIPTMSGIFFGESFSIAKLCIVILLIGFIYLYISKNAASKDDDVKVNKKWLLYCILAFVSIGMVGVIQKIHQSSAYKSEVSGFLFISFICAIIFCFFRSRSCEQKLILDKKLILIGLICGGCTFGMNYINLKLSGLLPSQLFFPLVNGSQIVLSSLFSVIVFKEKLSKRQTIGLVGGIVSLIAICIVP